MGRGAPEDTGGGGRAPDKQLAAAPSASPWAPAVGVGGAVVPKAPFCQCKVPSMQPFGLHNLAVGLFSP